MIEISNEDNMILMSRYPDKYFDLAIVDPPYGLGFGTFNRTNKDSNGVRFKADKYKNGDWDACGPNDGYFRELFRVSKNQIVWGGNYFPQLWQGPTRGIIFWNKQNPVKNFSDGELAWTSFDRVAKQFDFRYYGNLEGKTSAPEKIHPTQKPVYLYRALLEDYAKKGDKILDTHLGSGSIAIACDEMGFDLVACELDPEYYKAALKRLKEYQSAPRLDIPPQEDDNEQLQIAI